MSLRHRGLHYQSATFRILAVAGVVCVHLGVAAAIWLSSAQKEAPEMPDMASIQFVEISDDFVDAAPSQNQPAVDAAVLQAPPPETLPTPEPEAVPEPVVAPPRPEPVSEPDMVDPEPAPKPKPEPKPKPKPKPKPEPKPIQQARPLPETPALAPSASPANQAQSFLPSGQAQTPASPKAPSTSTEADTPRLISQVDYAGKRPVPEYPRASVRRSETGRVLVRVLISPTGEVLQASVQTSSGHSRLDESAVKAAKTARFKPYMENGVAKPALADIPFDFVL